MHFKALRNLFGRAVEAPKSAENLKDLKTIINDPKPKASSIPNEPVVFPWVTKEPKIESINVNNSSLHKSIPVKKVLENKDVVHSITQEETEVAFVKNIPCNKESINSIPKVDTGKLKIDPVITKGGEERQKPTILKVSLRFLLLLGLYSYLCFSYVNIFRQ